MNGGQPNDENSPFKGDDYTPTTSHNEAGSSEEDAVQRASTEMEEISLQKEEDDTPRYQPPPTHEAKAYYTGLPSSPRLLGRTSSTTVPWPRPLSPLQPGIPAFTRKSLSPIGDHRILVSWENKILPSITQAMSALAWTTIDVVRIGYNDVPILKRPVVVWVGVPTATLWNSSIRNALERSRAVLDDAGFPDVECEIRATDLNMFAKGMPELIKNIPTHFLYPVSSNVGTSMCPSTANTHVGSLCIYLSPSRSEPGSGPLWALTCRHIALPNDIYPSDKPYRRVNNSQPAVKINSPAPSHLQAVCTTSRDNIEYLERLVHDNPQDNVSQAHLTAEKKTLQECKRFEPEACLCAGSVYVAPKVEQAEYWGEGRETPYLWVRDWCLIELDRARFPNNARDLTNNVCLLSPHHTKSDLNRMLNTNPKNKIQFKYPKSSHLHLSGVMPMADIRNTAALNDDGQESFIVGKYGATTKQTWGCPSGILSVTRHVFKNGPPIETREWAIIGSLTDKKKAFSEPGDSGSLVFGTDGRLGGILTRGTGYGVDSDITYATPMEVVLADIKNVLGSEVQVL